MKRILCIVSSLDTGGAETFMMKMFRILSDECKIDFIVSATKGFYEKEVQQLGGRIYRVPLRTKHPIRTFRLIKKIVKKNNYKIILKLCDTPIGIFDLWAAKKGGAKKLCVRSCNASSAENKMQHIIYNILRPVFNRTANVKIAPSKLAAEYTFGKKIVDRGEVHFLHNAIDLNFYCYSDEGRNKIRSEFGIASSQLVVGHIGRLNYQKNHEFLIDVFSEIKKKRSDAMLLLIGDGEKKEKLKLKIRKLGLEKSVIFAGVREDIPNLLSAMDVFVFPSFYEGMPNTVIEAQATGLPCVLSDSITEEAAITNLVKYLPLSVGSQRWSEISLKMLSNIRPETRMDMIKAGYDIESSASEFTKIIFES